MSADFLSGRYVLTGDVLTPDAGAVKILRKIQDMFLLASSGRAPNFFVDSNDESFWEFMRFEDGQMTLRRVTREYIETNWPTVKCDERLVVERPIRY